MNNYNDMTIPEKLTCFVDGELAPDESGNLFYELAQNPEYQEELRQLVLMKNTFKNSMVSAPPALKSNVMKKTVYRDSPFTKLANAVALLISFILSKNSLTYAGMGLLAITAIFLLSDNKDAESPKQAFNNEIQNEKVIPEVSSKEVISNNLSSMLASDSDKSIIKKSTLSGNKVNSHKNEVKNNLPKELGTIESENPTQLQVEKVLLSGYEESDYFTTNFPGTNSSNIYYSSKFSRFLNKLSFSIKKFDGNSTPNFNLGNSSETMFNNVSIGLNYNIDYNQSVGLVIGFENFLMDFEKYEGDILYNYRQSYNTQWLGLQYSYTMNQMGESGIRPNLNVLAGATSIGPIFKLGAGITYHISDYFSVSGGIESGWLFYSNNGGLDNSTLFNTHKLGYNIGFNLGL